MKQEYILVFMIAILVFQRLTLVIHEFGHAIATLFNSDGNVTVYIGSYGNPKKSFRFKIMRLECFIKYNVFDWKGGLCVPHGKKTSWKNNVLVTLFGPLTTCIVGITTGLLVFFFVTNDAVKMTFYALTFTCLLDFFYNIVPRKSQIKLHDGTFINNDGKRLLYLWKTRTIHKLNIEAAAFYNSKEYAKSAELFEKCLMKVTDNQELYRLAISSYLEIRNHGKAAEIQEVYSKNYKNNFDLYDYVSLGVIQIYTEDLEGALDTFKKALTLDTKNVIVLCNLGLTYGLLDRHEEAIIDLDKVISIDPSLEFAWQNRGFSKLKLGQLENGYADLQKSLELNDQDPYAHRNLGLYYFYKKDYQKALDLYKKAQMLDTSTHHIQEYITEVEARL